MLTVELLRAYGANVDEALKRCMNNEAFYLRLVDRAINDPDFEGLPEAVEQKDLDRGFELAHRLKGVMANLSLTPLGGPIAEITELLRSRTDTDYGPYLEEIAAQRKRLFEMIRGC